MALSGVYVQYYRAPSPPRAAWRDDIGRIAEAGFAGIQLRPQWRWHERSDGQFAWDDLHELCQLAGEHSLRVVVQFIAEMAPSWFLAKYRPYRADRSGAVRPPGAISAMYVGGWEPCYDHPAVPEFASRFIASGVAALKEHACIEAWHVWNEPRSRPNWDCGCPHSVRAYRDWLRLRYGTVETLNDVTGKAWGDFEHVEPPTQNSDYTEVFLWRTWAVERVAPRVAWAAKAARSADPARPVWSHVGYATLGQNPLNDGSPDWLVAQQVDRYGLSMPVRGSAIGEMDTRRWPAGPSMLCDWLRCVSPSGRYHAWEVYPDLGFGIQGVPPEDFGKWLWQAAAAAAERICIWQYRSERMGTESGDAGLVEVDGSDKPHRLQASAFIRKWNEHRDVFDALEPAAPKVWIAYDSASHMLWHVEQAGNAEYLCGPGPASTPRPNSPTRPSLFAWHHIFRKAGFEVGWLSCDLLAAGRVDLPPADSLIVLPSLYMLDEQTASRLAAWTRAGGRLLVVAQTASRCPSTFVKEDAPGAALSELLGLREMPYRWCDPSKARLPLRCGEMPAARIGQVPPQTTEPIWPIAVPRGLGDRDGALLASWPDGTPGIVGVDADRGKAIWLGAALDVEDAPTLAAAERLIPVLLNWLQMVPQIGGGAASGWGAGWLSQPYELRLAVHPTRGEFLWVFAEAGAHVRLPGWQRAYDWLTGEVMPADGFAARDGVLCLSKSAKS